MSGKRSGAFAVGALLSSSLLLGGCVTSGSSPMDAHAEAPAPRKTSAYPPVEDLPQKREVSPMTADEQSKLKKELMATRERQESAAKNQ
jgi:hypothetical protein